MPVIKPKAKAFPFFWYPPKGNAGLGAWFMGRIVGAWHREEKLSAKGAKYDNYTVTLASFCLFGTPEGTGRELNISVGGSNLSILEDIFPQIPAGKGVLPKFNEIGKYLGGCYLSVEGNYPQPEFCFAETEVEFLADFNNAFLEPYRAIMGQPEATAWDKITSWHDAQPSMLREYMLKNGMTVGDDYIPF